MPFGRRMSESGGPMRRKGRVPQEACRSHATSVRPPSFFRIGLAPSRSDDSLPELRKVRQPLLIGALAWNDLALPEQCEVGEDVGDVLVAQRRIRQHAAPRMAFAYGSKPGFVATAWTE